MDCICSCADQHTGKNSCKRGKSQGPLGGNYNHHMAATLQLFDGFIRPQRVAEPMAATLLKPMDSPVGLNHKQARQDVMPFDMLFDAHCTSVHRRKPEE